MSSPALEKNRRVSRRDADPPPSPRPPEDGGRAEFGIAGDGQAGELSEALEPARAGCPVEESGGGERRDCRVVWFHGGESYGQL